MLGRVEDMAERFAFHRANGREIGGLFDPNRDAPYGHPPLFWSPVLSPRGAKLSWTEGPKFSLRTGRLVGVWTLVVADSRTGAESVRVNVGRRNEWLAHADYDGRYWVGTFAPSGDLTPPRSELRVRVVDTWAADPRPISGECSRGFVASIDRFVKE